MNSKKYSVVLCDGDFPTHPVPLSVLRGARYVCCCDGAGQKFIDRGGHPDAIVGDGDSLSDEFKHQHADILHLVGEQDDNDQTKATRHLVAQGERHIAYLGATGKREDHTLGNISLLARYHDEMHLDVEMFTDYGCFVPASGRHTFSSFKRQQVSIYNISCTRLTSEGLRWQAYPYRSLWQGGLNEALADNFTLDGDGSYLVFQTYEAKLTEPESM